MSKKPIRKVAVLGAGVMGSGIAAHLTNAGIPVLLLDIVPPDLDPKEKSKAKRDAFAAGALKKLKKAKPAAFFHKGNASMITVGNFDDDLEKVADCDLIIEAIIERLDIKQSLFAKLEKITDDNTIVASNTSGLRIVDMLSKSGAGFKKRFLITHFFNPPRYMKLLELVAGPETDKGILDRIADFGRNVLGKGIVWAKDTPNFVANRVGAHSMMKVIHLMLEKGLSPEDVDAITGTPMGHPRSATFRTGDMVGLDTLGHVVKNCYEMLTDDEDRDTFKTPEFVATMIERKQLGNKTRGGFYKKSKKGIEVLDPQTGEYRPKAGNQDIKKACKSIAKVEDPAARIKKLVATDGPIGDFAWLALSSSMAYSANRVGEVCDDIIAIDDGMRWGYNWELGPFETWDALGFRETYERMKSDGIALPASIVKMYDSGATAFYKDGNYYDLQKADYAPLKVDAREATLQILKRGESPVLANNGAEAWDIGDGVLAVRFKTKMNSLEPDNIQMLHDATAKAEEDFEAVVITNGGDNFCVGANLFLVAVASSQKKWDDIKALIKSYQYATQRMKYAQVPVVAAPFGMTLGGGLELCYGCDSVQAAAETYAGLVEVGVGLIPGGAGTLNMLWRSLETVPDGMEIDTYAHVTQVFKNIAMANVATSAQEAQQKNYFRKSDGISFDKARLLHEAKQRAIGLARSGYHPPQAREYVLPGESGIATLKMMVNTLVAGGYATEHDALIANKLAVVLCGGVSGAAGPVNEDRMLELECEAFLSLCGEAKSQARMQAMLTTKKPLRN